MMTTCRVKGDQYMDVMDIYKDEYEQYKSETDSYVDKYSWVASQVFGLVTYDPVLDKRFVKDIFEVCRFILRKDCYNFIKDPFRERYVQFILVCQLLIKKQWINWASDLRVVWFDTAELCCPEPILDVEHWSQCFCGEEYTVNRVEFSEDNLKLLIEFVEEDTEPTTSEISLEQEEPQMLQEGLFARCERCGYTEFFPNTVYEKAQMKYDISGWGSIQDKTVCPSCLVYYEKMIEQLFNDFWDKQEES